MRVISSKEVEEPRKEEPKKKDFNETLVEQFGKEFYGNNFFGSLGILSKSEGLCDNAKFFWKLMTYTSEIGTKIKEFLLRQEYPFIFPAIPAPEIDKEQCLFCQALDYENKRIEELYKLTDEAPCGCTKSFINKLIKKHSEIQHLLSLAHKINEMSEDKLLVQQSVYKLICQ